MKTGDYVRFKTISNEIKIGKITKIVEPEHELSMHCYTVYDVDDNEATVDNYIIKSSPNIIDLIEVGDYVNGVEVIGFEYDNDNKKYLQCGLGDYVVCTYYEEDFKTIVTKEQFKSMEYEI